MTLHPARRTVFSNKQDSNEPLSHYHRRDRHWLFRVLAGLARLHRHREHARRSGARDARGDRISCRGFAPGWRAGAGTAHPCCLLRNRRLTNEDSIYLSGAVWSVGKGEGRGPPRGVPPRRDYQRLNEARQPVRACLPRHRRRSQGRTQPGLPAATLAAQAGSSRPRLPPFAYSFSSNTRVTQWLAPAGQGG